MKRTCLCRPSHARWTPRQLDLDRYEPGAWRVPWHIVAGIVAAAIVLFGGGQ